MAEQHLSATELVRRESEEGRLPLLAGARVWAKNMFFLWTTFAFGAATWALLTGGFIGFYVDFPRGAGAFFAGHASSFMLLIVGLVIPCAKYGVDAIDYAKSQFGVYGSQVVLLALITIVLGWGGVLLFLAQDAVVNIWNEYVASDPISNRWLPGLFGLAILASCWAFVSRGPRAFIGVAKVAGPAIILLVLAMFFTLIAKEGLDIFTQNPAPSDPPLAKDYSYSLMAEWAFGYGLSWWTAAGAYSRLSSGPRKAWWIIFLSWSVMQVCIVLIAILAGLASGQTDPILWMVPLLGVGGGLVALAFVLLANWTSIAGILYIGAVACQQLPVFRRVPWWALTALMASPGVYLVFWPEYFKAHYATFLYYNAILIAPSATIHAVDYYLLRKQRIDPRALYSFKRGDKYWYWGGFNWVAIGVCAGCFFFYVWLLNPITTESNSPFQYITATLPTIALAALAYYVLMRFIAIPVFNKGSYPAGRVVPRLEEAVPSVEM